MYSYRLYFTPFESVNLSILTEADDLLSQYLVVIFELPDPAAQV